MSSSGKKVRTIAQERVDKPDFDASGSLVYDYLDSALGALLGYGGGLLSTAKVTYTDNGVTYLATLGTFHAYWSSREVFDAPTSTYRAWQGKVLTHTPGGSQVSALDYTANRAAAVAANVVPTGIPVASPGAFPFVWMRPSDVDTNTEARRAWSGAAEAGVAMLTRTTTLLEFTIADSPPSSVGGEWTPIAKITAWAGAGTATLGLPTLTQLSVWDGGGVRSGSAYSDPWRWADAEQGLWYDPDGNTSTASRLLPSIAGGVTFDGFGPTGQSPSLGLIQMLYVVRARIKRLLADDGSVSWLTAPAATLKALKATVDVNTAALASFATVYARSRVIGAAHAIYDPGLGAYSVTMSSNKSVATLPSGWAYAAVSGTMVLKWATSPTTPPAGVGSTGSLTIHVTPAKNADGSYTLGQRVWVAAVYPHDGTEWILDVRTLDDTGAAKPGSFSVTVIDSLV